MNENSMENLMEKAIKVNCTTTLFFARIGNIKKEELQQYCEEFGPIKDISMMTDPKTQKPKGCAFVKFMTYEDAHRCVEESVKRNQRDLIKKNWVIEWAKSSQIKEENLDKTTIYISNLNENNKNQKMIKMKFQQYGNIEQITLIENSKGIFAFVKFDNIESAVEAINKENGNEWCGKRIVVEFSEAQESKRNRRQKATLKKNCQNPNTFHRTSQYSPHIQKNENQTKHKSSKSYSNSLTPQQLERIMQDMNFNSMNENNRNTHSGSHSRSDSGHQRTHSNPFTSPFDVLTPIEDDVVDLPIFKQLSSNND